MIVLDTCAVIYWTLDPIKLSESAKRTIEQDDILYMSSISIWEIGIKIIRKRIIIPLSIDNFVQRLKKIDKLTIVPVDDKIWIENLNLQWEHRDPADRTIVATAKLNNCPLVTADKNIAKFYKQTVW